MLQTPTFCKSPSIRTHLLSAAFSKICRFETANSAYQSDFFAAHPSRLWGGKWRGWSHRSGLNRCVIC